MVASPEVNGTAGAPSRAPALPSKPLRVVRRFGRHAGPVIALAYLLLIVGVAILAPMLAPADPGRQDLLNAYATPSGQHLLGTDYLGRDILSRLIYGARVSLSVAILVVGFALLISLPIGLVSGYIGGRTDNAFMRLVDVFLSVPPIVLALTVVGVWGPGLRNVVASLTIVIAPGFVRLVRGEALAIRERVFVDASRAIGSGHPRIIARRIVPNVRAPLIVSAAFTCGLVLLAEASLSYLGLGVQPPQASWGSMLRDAYDFALFSEGWQLLIPGAAIAATALAFNTVGDGLRDALGVTGQTQIGRKPKARVTAVESKRGVDDRADQRGSLGIATPLDEKVLEIENLSVELVTGSGRIRVVDDVTLSVGTGEVVGLVGESGSGKTVTALSVLRLLSSPPAYITHGHVWFDGMDLLDVSPKTLRRIRGNDIAMIFQDPLTSLNPVFTVGNQLIEAQRLHRAGSSRDACNKRALELLDLVGIPDSRHRMRQYPHELSGGMQQRVVIAMALACDPKLLIADEPTTALDVTIQAQILELLGEVRREVGMSVLFVSHSMGVVADICDRVAVMYAGQIVEEAGAAELFQSPVHPYTRGLLRALPDLSTRVSRMTPIPGQVPLPWDMPSGCRFQPRCSHAIPRCEIESVRLTVAGPSRSGRCLRQGELLEAVREDTE